MPGRAPLGAPQPPREEEIRERLGGVYPLYRALLEGGPFVPEWKFYGAKYGWSLKLFEKKRNLCFINPKDGSFDVAFNFGDRAAEAVLAGTSSEAVKEALRAARRYAEGRGVRLTVASAPDLDEVRRLLAVKRAR